MPVETPKVKVSCEITPHQSIHYHLKMRNAIPSFTGCPHVCLYHSDSVIYKALPHFSPQNQQCSSKQDNIHFRWARRRYSITYIQCLRAISHYHSLPRTEKGMEIKACACFVPISLCLPCSEQLDRADKGKSLSRILSWLSARQSEVNVYSRND